MRYQCTTGLAREQLLELDARIFQVLESGPHRAGRPVLLGRFRQVELALCWPARAARRLSTGDLFGVSQPTVSRIWRHLLPLLEEVTGMSQIGLAEAIRNRCVLVDGTYIHTGNRASTGGATIQQGLTGRVDETRTHHALILQLDMQLPAGFHVYHEYTVTIQRYVIRRQHSIAAEK